MAKPIDLDLQLSERPVTVFDFRTGKLHEFMPTVRHVVKALEGECPLCGARLLFAERALHGVESPVVGRCDACWLDFVGRLVETEGERDWHLDVAERDPPWQEWRNDASYATGIPPPETTVGLHLRPSDGWQVG